MGMQVNVRLEEAEWEQIVAAMPGMSNGERMSRLVRQQLTLLESHHDLARALELIEAALDPTLQALRRQRLQGQGSEVAEELAQSVIEMAALLLAHTDDLAAAPEKHVAGLEAKLARRWSRSAMQLLRAVALDPSQIRNQQHTAPELQRILAQAAQLSSTAVHAGGASPISTADTHLLPPLSSETLIVSPNKG